MEEGGKGRRRENTTGSTTLSISPSALCSLLLPLFSFLLPLSSLLLYIRFDIRKRRAVSTGIPRRLA